MQLGDYLAVLRKQWWVVALITALTMTVVGALSFTATPIFSSTASVFVSLPFGNTAGELFQGSTYVQGQMQSYAELAESPAVLQPVIEELGLDITPEDLARNVEATTSGETVILALTANATDPQRAADIANATAASLADVASSLAPKRSNGDPAVQIDPIENAQPPQFQSSPDKRRDLAAAMFIGLLLGSGFALARHLLDARLRSVAEIQAEAAPLPVLGEILTDPGASREVAVMRDNPAAVVGEGYRRLRVNLQFLEVIQRPLTCVVTSARPGEGKSTIAVNLAFACASAGERVLLIDADLRKPRIDRILGLVQTAGLTTVLTGRATVGQVLQHAGVDPAIDVLTSGQIPPNPAELLGSPAMTELLASVRPHYDVILIDSPPLLPVVDAAVITRQASGAVVVARVNAIHRGDVARATAQLDQAGGSAMGIVVNGIKQAPGSGYSYKYADPVKAKRK